MTGNQIQYWNLQETKRSNLAKEGETHRSNLVNEGIKQDTLSETRRSNLVSESLASDRLKMDQTRSNYQNRKDAVNTMVNAVDKLSPLGGNLLGLLLR